MKSDVNRRTFMKSAAALSLLGLGGSPSIAAFAQDDGTDPLKQLRFLHPETLAFAAPFLLMQQQAGLDDVADNVEFNTWTNPDILRTTLVKGESEVTAVPTYVGANLFNRGIDIRMAAVVVWGLIWVLGPDGEPAEWESLRGQTIMIPYANDMPDLVFRYLAVNNGLTPGEDFEIQYFAQPPEVVSQLVAGKGQWAVLPEHVATLALMQAKKNDLGIGRLLNLQEEWGKVTGLEPRIPQAGIVVPSWLAEDRPDVVSAVLDGLTEAVATVNEASPETVAALSEGTGVPEPAVADVIPRLNLNVVAAADAREDLERFYSELFTLSPDIIGGELPDASFYLEDPR